jgi:hypothetical protein
MAGLLEGKIAIVTGVASGIGQAAALTQLPQLECENKFFAGMGFGNT